MVHKKMYIMNNKGKNMRVISITVLKLKLLEWIRKVPKNGLEMDKQKNAIWCYLQKSY